MHLKSLQFLGEQTCCISFCLMFIFMLQIGKVHAENADLRANACFDMGVFAFGEKDYQSAIDSFKRALMYQPDNPYYIHFLGKSYLESGLYSKALKAFQQAKQINPYLHELDNDTALLYFKLKQYDKAARLFIEIIQNDPLNENIAAHYFAGLSLYYEKQYQKAIPYLKYVSEKNDDLMENCLFHISICLYRMDQKDKAIQSFKRLASKGLSLEIKKMSQKWLKAIQERNMYNPYKLLAKISFQCDDNAGFVAPYLKTSNDDDMLLNVYVNGKYRLIRSSKYEIGTGYKHLQTIHQDLTEFDITGSTINLYGKYKYDQTILGISYRPAYYWLNHERFMVKHRFTPQVTWKVSEIYALRMSYTYANNHYYEDATQNGHSHILSWMNTIKIKPYHCTVFITTTAEENHAAGRNKQYEQFRGNFGVKISLPNNTLFKINSKFQAYRHAHMDMALQKKRKDHTSSLGFELSHPLYNRTLWAGIGYYYSHNNSNMDYYDYRKNVISLIWTLKY
jgi:tetratricopeptide (TPR) repeat protein